MTLESILQVKYGRSLFTLKVKSIKIEGAWYFFVKDDNPNKGLLGKEILELAYTEPIDPSKEAAVAKPKNIPAKIISAIRNKILEEKDWWYF